MINVELSVQKRQHKHSIIILQSIIKMTNTKSQIGGGRKKKSLERRESDVVR